MPWNDNIFTLDFSFRKNPPIPLDTRFSAHPLKDREDISYEEYDPELDSKQAYLESRYDPKAKSNAGAKGVFQVMDSVASDYVKDTGDTGDIYDPDYNKKVRDWQMQKLWNSPTINSGNAPTRVKVAKMLAAYNWGRGNLQNYLLKLKREGKDIYTDNSWVDGLPFQTKEYISFLVDNQPISNGRNIEDFNKNKSKYESLYD